MYSPPPLLFPFPLDSPSHCLLLPLPVSFSLLVFPFLCQLPMLLSTLPIPTHIGFLITARPLAQLPPQLRGGSRLPLTSGSLLGWGLENLGSIGLRLIFLNVWRVGTEPQLKNLHELVGVRILRYWYPSGDWLVFHSAGYLKRCEPGLRILEL